MLNNNSFKIAVIISLIVHGAILLQNPNFSIFATQKKESHTQLNYVKTQAVKQELPHQSSKEPLLKFPAKITIDKKIPPPFVDKEDIFKTKVASSHRDADFSKPILAKPDILAIKKKITLPPIPIGKDKINNPSYISYYQIVREKIKRAAYQNYTGREEGEVAVSFIIASNGELTEIRLTEEKSSPSIYLREVALRSVKDASPFPNFPKELDHPQLSFNLAITFEIE